MSLEDGFYCTAMDLLILSLLGLDPWDVFRSGARKLSGISFGTGVIFSGVGVRLLWNPLRFLRNPRPP